MSFTASSRDVASYKRTTLPPSGASHSSPFTHHHQHPQTVHHQPPPYPRLQSPPHTLTASSHSHSHSHQPQPSPPAFSPPSSPLPQPQAGSTSPPSLLASSRRSSAPSLLVHNLNLLSFHSSPASPTSPDRYSNWPATHNETSEAHSSLHYSISKQLGTLHPSHPAATAGHSSGQSSTSSSPPPQLTRVSEFGLPGRSTSHATLLSSYPPPRGERGPTHSPPLHTNPATIMRRHSVQDPHTAHASIAQLQQQMRDRHKQASSHLSSSLSSASVGLPLSRGLVTSSSSGSLRSFSSVVDENDAILPPGARGSVGSVGGLLLNEGGLHRSSSHSSVNNAPISASSSSGSLRGSFIHPSSSASSLPLRSSSLSNTPTRSSSPSLPRYLGVSHQPTRRYSTPVVTLSATQAAHLLSLQQQQAESNGSSRASPSMLSPPLSPSRRTNGLHLSSTVPHASSSASHASRGYAQSSYTMPLSLQPKSPSSAGSSPSLLAPVEEQSEREREAGHSREGSMGRDGDNLQWVGTAHGGGYTMTLQVATGGQEPSPRGETGSGGTERSEGKETSAILMRRQRTRELTSPIITAKSDDDSTTPTHRSGQKWSLDISPSPTAAAPRSASALSSVLSSTFPTAHPTTFSPPALDPRRSSLPSSLSSPSRRHSLAFLQSQLLSLYFVHHMAPSDLSAQQLQLFDSERCPVCLTADLQPLDPSQQVTVTVLTCKEQQCEHILHSSCLSSPLASALIIAHPVGAEVSQPIELRRYAPNLLGAGSGRSGAARPSKRTDCVYELTVVHWMVDVVAVKLSSMAPASAAISTHRTVSAVYSRQTGMDVITLYNAAAAAAAASSSPAPSFSATTPVAQPPLPFFPFSHGRLIFSCQCHVTAEEWQLHAELDLRPVQAADSQNGRRRDEYELVYRYEKGSGLGGEGELHVVVSEGQQAGVGGQQGWFVQSVRFEVDADSVAPSQDSKAPVAARHAEPLPPPPPTHTAPTEGRRLSRTPEAPQASQGGTAHSPTSQPISGGSNAAVGSTFSAAAPATHDALRYTTSTPPAPPAQIASYPSQQQQHQQQQQYQPAQYQPQQQQPQQAPPQVSSPPTPQSAWYDALAQQQSELHYLMLLNNAQMHSSPLAQPMYQPAHAQQPLSPLSPYNMLTAPYALASPYALPLSPDYQHQLLSLSPPPPPPPPALPASTPGAEYAYILLPSGAIQAVPMTPQFQQSLMYGAGGVRGGGGYSGYEAGAVGGASGVSHGQLSEESKYGGGRLNPPPLPPPQQQPAHHAPSHHSPAHQQHHPPTQQQQQQQQRHGRSPIHHHPTHSPQHSHYQQQPAQHAAGGRGQGQYKQPPAAQQQQQQTSPHNRVLSPQSAHRPSSSTPPLPSTSPSPTHSSASFHSVAGGAEAQLVLLAKSQAGSRMLQQRLSAGVERAYYQSVLGELLPHLPALMRDLFGNYAVQKLVEAGSEADRGRMLDCVKDSFVEVSCDRQGTRAMQKLMECVTRHDDRQWVVNALLASSAAAPQSATAANTAAAPPLLLRLIRDPNGCHVVDSVLSHFPAPLLPPLHAQIFRAVRVLGVDQHGLCILKRAISGASDELFVPFALSLSSGLLEFVNNAYGNYLVQHVLQHCNPDPPSTHASPAASASINASFAHALRGHLSRLARAKFSSNVVERMLRISDKELVRGMVRELTSEDGLRALLSCSYGNFVLVAVVCHGCGEDESEGGRVMELLGREEVMGGVRKNVRSKWERAISQYRERGWGGVDRQALQGKGGPGNERS